MSTAARRTLDTTAETNETTAFDASADDADPQIARLNIAIANETSLPLDEALVRTAVARTLAPLTGRTASISVAVVDDDVIRRLNAQFLSHDYATDVLSFVLVDRANRLESEIVISADAVRRNAIEAGWNPSAEMLLYVVHGVLHCCGFDDAAPSDAAKMRVAEAHVLRSIGVAFSPTDDRWRAHVPLIDDIGSEA